MDNINRPKENGAYAKNNFIDEKFILIHANLNIVIYNISANDIDLNTLIKYFFDSNFAGYFSNILEDTGDIYKYHYANYITSSTAAEVITRIKLELQSRTLQMNNINTQGE